MFSLFIFCYDGTSTTEDVVTAINAVSNDFSNALANPLIPSASTVLSQTTTGSGSQAAAYSLNLEGDTITFQVSATGAQGGDGTLYNNIRVMVVDDADATTGDTGERADYNAMNKVLTLHVRSDETTSTAKIAVKINDLSNFFDALSILGSGTMSGVEPVFNQIQTGLQQYLGPIYLGTQDRFRSADPGL